ncbi:hypothetical protein BE221DRAFT_83674 [Ostreococcus tauri]|uniref:Inositol-phosphate phosphatase n=1 Tax=Ostreococcus tauri TaxID=70448 RepID=A0A1Y5I7K7_OSTTA|nr:hypothetical protein BE221DRAFT_83674 [Ostreococcus tauri]
MASTCASAPSRSASSRSTRASIDHRRHRARRFAFVRRRNAVSVEASPDGTSLERVLEAAVRAAQEGGTVMARKVGAEVIKTKANARDLLTEVDGEVQRIIEAKVAEEFPHHGFLGEESVAAGKDASSDALREVLETGPDWLWVVDPIDGTTNFVHGLPLSAISIGVAYKGELQVAVIMDPFRDECFTAILGGGAKLNGTPIKVGEEATALEAVVVTGYAPTDASTEVMLKGMTGISRSSRREARKLILRSKY